MIRADEVREWAENALAQGDYQTERCAYYVIDGAEVFVIRSVYGNLFGANVSFDELENGDVIAWFARDMFNLRNEAGKMAQRVDEWRKWCKPYSGF